MKDGRNRTFFLGAMLALLMLTPAVGQISTPGPQGPVIQDRMIFFEAALLQVDRRLQMAEANLKAKEAQIAKLEKDLKAATERNAALEKRLAAVEAAIKKTGDGLD